MDRVARNIYLAGKIAPWGRGNANDWRFAIAPTLQECVSTKTLGAWMSPDEGWPVLLDAIFGQFNYCGPFFTDLTDRWGGHGGGLAYPHAVNVAEHSRWNHGSDTPIIRALVTELCLKAIAKADLVFAWIDSPDCYGTLFELGYAKALGKRIAVRFTRGDFFAPEQERPFIDSDANVNGVPDPFYELWFTYFACDGLVTRLPPKNALWDVIAELGWIGFPRAFDSPLEAAFAEEWGRRGFHLTYPLHSQYSLQGGRYFLDFAFAPLKVGIELDGYTYHSDRDAFNRDRRRQREIEAEGWRIIRFSGDEIRQNVAQCVQETAHQLSIYKHRKD